MHGIYVHICLCVSLDHCLLRLFDRNPGLVAECDGCGCHLSS